MLTENTGLSYSWAVKECAFWVKTCKDASPLPDVFLGTLSCLESISMIKCVSIALSDIEGDGTIVCVLLYFRPTGSPGYFWLSQETDSVVPRKVAASAAGLSFFS